ncbi:hypothetical protein BGZ82_000116, partial [Podila clonocystis]
MERRPISPILWEDVVAYRLKIKDEIKFWTYHEYFTRTRAEKSSFLKNAHYIHVFTSQHSQLLGILNDTSCVNLIKVNCVVDGSLVGLSELTQLI